MAISGVSDMSMSLASQAGAMKAGEVGQQIGVAIMKEIMDQQKMMGEQIVKMIQSGPSPDGVGSIVDVSA